MARFVAVIHNWFMDHNYSEIEEIEAVDLEDATRRAKEMAYDRRSTFNATKATVIELEGDLRLQPRKLTWRERFTGRIGPND